MTSEAAQREVSATERHAGTSASTRLKLAVSRKVAAILHARSGAGSIWPFEFHARAAAGDGLPFESGNHAGTGTAHFSCRRAKNISLYRAVERCFSAKSWQLHLVFLLIQIT